MIKLSIIHNTDKEDAIKIVSNSEILNLPVYGKASAGRGYLNMDSPDYYMPILRGNFSKRSFFVEITGNSMEPTLEDGEFALVDPDIQLIQKIKFMWLLIMMKVI